MRYRKFKICDFSWLRQAATPSKMNSAHRVCLKNDVPEAGVEAQFCSTVLRQRQIEQSGTGDSSPTPRLSKGRANEEGLVCHAASARRRRRYVFCTK